MPNGSISLKKSNFKTIIVFGLSFFLPMAIFSLIWASNGIGFCGSLNPLTLDMNSQYYPFFSSLSKVYSGEYSLFYNWSISMGGNYLALFAYYLSSPFNLLFLFLKQTDVVFGIYIVSILKVGFCGLNFSLFLKYGINDKTSNMSQIVFACCYALMSYNVAYSVCIMWIDGVVFLPLVLLGIEMLLEKKRGLLYFASITIVLFANYYMAYMVGLFSVAYLLTGFIRNTDRTNSKDNLLIILRFGILSISGLLISAILLFPALLSYFTTANLNPIAEENFSGAYEYTFLQLLKKLLPQQYDTLLISGTPMIYCGTGIVILCFVFFFMKRISWREKIAYVVLMIITGMGFLVQHVDMVWHGLRIPHSYMYRYSFLFSTVIIIMAYKAWAIICLYNRYNIIKIVLMAFSIVELYLNGAYIISCINEEFQYGDMLVEYEKNTIYSDLINKILEDTSCFRVGQDVRITMNDSIMYGVKGLDSYTSTYNYEIVQFLTLLGADTEGNYNTTSRGITPFMDSLLGVKYRIATSEISSIYEFAYEADDGICRAVLYENPYSLNLGYAAPTNFNKNMQFGEDGLKNQNMLASNLTNSSAEIYQSINYFVDEESTYNKVILHVTLEEDICAVAYVQAYYDLKEKWMPNAEPSIFTISVDGDIRASHDGSSTNIEPIRKHIFELGTISAGQHVIELSGPSYLALSYAGIYDYHETEAIKVISQISKRQLIIDNFGNDFVTGHFEVDKDQVLATTIPYVEGIHVILDGKEIDMKKGNTPFLIIDAEEGKHAVTIRYQQIGLNEGLAMMIMGILLASVYFGIPLLQNKRTRIEKCKSGT